MTTHDHTAAPTTREERLQAIRAQLGFTVSGPHPLIDHYRTMATDQHWLLDEVDRLHSAIVAVHNAPDLHTAANVADEALYGEGS